MEQVDVVPDRAEIATWALSDELRPVVEQGVEKAERDASEECSGVEALDLFPKVGDLDVEGQVHDVEKMDRHSGGVDPPCEFTPSPVYQISNGASLEDIELVALGDGLDEGAVCLGDSTQEVQVVAHLVEAELPEGSPT